MQPLPVAGLGQKEQEGLTLGWRWRFWPGQVWRIVWDSRMRNNSESCDWSGWSFRVIPWQRNSQNFKTDGCRLHRGNGTGKVPPTFQAMVVLGFQKSLVQECRISWNSASFIQKMKQCLVIFMHTTQISVLLVWLLKSQAGFCSTKLNSNKQLVLSSVHLWKVHFVLFYSEKEYKLYFMQSLH